MIDKIPKPLYFLVVFSAICVLISTFSDKRLKSTSDSTDTTKPSLLTKLVFSVQAASSTNTPVSATPAATYPAVPSPWPTVDIPTRVLPDGFSIVHIPAEQMEGVKFIKVGEVIVLENGDQVTASDNGILLTGHSCSDFTMRDALAITYLMSRQFGQSFKFTGPLIGSESAFIFYEQKGDGCFARQNSQGAPAYCAGQIYQPTINGVPGATHPEFELYPQTKGSRASLQDGPYCIAASMKVFRDDFGGNSFLAAANYKGFASASDPIFIANYMPWYNAGGVYVDGTFIPFTDNESVLRKLIGEELSYWEQNIKEFYSMYPDFYGN